MSHRCRGRVPRALRVERQPAHYRRREREVAKGKCPVCGAWVFVLPNGLLHAHVNQQVRRADARGES